MKYSAFIRWQKIPEVGISKQYLKLIHFCFCVKRKGSQFLQTMKCGHYLSTAGGRKWQKLSNKQFIVFPTINILHESYKYLKQWSGNIRELPLFSFLAQSFKNCIQYIVRKCGVAIFCRWSIYVERLILCIL